MAISLRSLIGGSGVEIGECVFLPYAPDPLVEIDGMSFIRSGYLVVGEEDKYPEAYDLFSNPDGSLGVPTLTTNLYMRIK